MICERGHRVIDSTDLHYSLREVGPGLFEYVYGDCDELEAAECEREREEAGA